jgi:hypothetical protein
MGHFDKIFGIWSDQQNNQIAPLGQGLRNSDFHPVGAEKHIRRRCPGCCQAESRTALGNQYRAAVQVALAAKKPVSEITIAS